MREAARPTIDMDHLAGDVAGAGRGEKSDEPRQVLRFADIACRAVRLDPSGLRLRRRQEALVDLLGMNPARRDAVDRYAVPADDAGQRLGPDMDGAVRRD